MMRNQPLNIIPSVLDTFYSFLLLGFQKIVKIHFDVTRIQSSVVVSRMLLLSTIIQR